MGYFARIAAIILLLGILNQSFGSKINCENLSTASCKTLYGETFDNEFKSIHLDTMKSIIKRYLKINSELINELPSSYSEYIEVVKKSTENINAELREVDENLNENYGKLANLVKRLDVINIEDSDNADPPLPKEVQEIFDRNNWKNYVIENICDILDKINLLSMDLYDGLREEDLKDFPVYNTINELNKKVSDAKKDDLKGRAIILYEALKIITTNFEVPYLEKIRKITE